MESGSVGESVEDRAGEEAWCLVVFAAPDDPEELADALVETLGLHPTDALVQARRAPGVLPVAVSRKLAEKAAHAIAAIGLRAQALEVEQVPSLHHAVRVHHLRCLDIGLEIIELHGQPARFMPWNEIELVSVGQVPLETAKHFAAAESTSITLAHPRRIDVTEVALSPGPEAWIVRLDAAQAYRIDHKRVNYEYLGARKTDSATTNFRLLLEDLLKHAPGAYLTPATRAYAEHGPVESYSFSSSEELQRATVLHLLIHRLARLPS
jgi:hypothetical protein